MARTKGKRRESEKTGTRKIVLYLLSCLNPSVIASYWHTVTDALSMQILSPTDRRTTKQTNHYTITASW